MPDYRILCRCQKTLNASLLHRGGIDPLNFLVRQFNSMTGKSRDPVIAEVEMPRSARMAAMRKLRCGGGRRDEGLVWAVRYVSRVGI